MSALSREMADEKLVGNASDCDIICPETETHNDPKDIRVGCFGGIAMTAFRKLNPCRWLGGRRFWRALRKKSIIWSGLDKKKPSSKVQQDTSAETNVSQDISDETTGESSSLENSSSFAGTRNSQTTPPAPGIILNRKPICSVGDVTSEIAGTDNALPKTPLDVKASSIVVKQAVSAINIHREIQLDVISPAPPRQQFNPGNFTTREIEGENFDDFSFCKSICDRPGTEGTDF